MPLPKGTSEGVLEALISIAEEGERDDDGMLTEAAGEDLQRAAQMCADPAKLESVLAAPDEEEEEDGRKSEGHEFQFDSEDEDDGRDPEGMDRFQF